MPRLCVCTPLVCPSVCPSVLRQIGLKTNTVPVFMKPGQNLELLGHGETQRNYISKEIRFMQSILTIFHISHFAFTICYMQACPSKAPMQLAAVSIQMQGKRAFFILFLKDMCLISVISISAHPVNKAQVSKHALGERGRGGSVFLCCQFHILFSPTDRTPSICWVAAAVTFRNMCASVIETAQNRNDGEHWSILHEAHLSFQSAGLAWDKKNNGLGIFGMERRTASASDFSLSFRLQMFRAQLSGDW